MNKWKVKKHRGQCAVSGAAFEPGDSFFSVIFEENDMLMRKDFSVNAFDDQWRSKSFSFWKSKVPIPDEDDGPKHKLIDMVTLMSFYRKLTTSDNDSHAGFAYLIALLLMRKKYLRLKDIQFKDGEEWMILLERKTKTVHRMRDPHLTKEELSELRGQLSELFESPEMFDREPEKPEESDDSAEDGEVLDEAEDIEDIGEDELENDDD